MTLKEGEQDVEAALGLHLPREVSKIIFDDHIFLGRCCHHTQYDASDDNHDKYSVVLTMVESIK